MAAAHNPRAGMGERVWLCESCVWLLSDRDLDSFYNKPELGWRAALVGAVVTIVVSLVFLLLLLFGLIGFAL
jgi:hypothetical protein